MTGGTVAGRYEGDLVVVEKSAISARVIQVVLASVGRGSLPAWQPGAHIDLLLPNGITRQYSLTGDPMVQDRWRLAVQKEETSRGGSEYIHEALDVGDVIAARGPWNHFELTEASSYHFVAGGIGITPLLPMILQTERAGRPWRLDFCGGRRAELAFLPDLLPMGDRVSMHVREEGRRLDTRLLVGGADDATEIYCCGPTSLMDAVLEACAASGRRPARVERFVPKAADESARDTEFEVEFTESGITARVPPGRSILEVARESGIQVLASCEEGTCGTCETAVLQGIPDHRDSVLSDDEKAANDYMMICVSRSSCSRLVLGL